MSEEATPDPFPVPASTARELLRCCPYGREAQRDAEDAIRREELPTFALYSSYQHDAGGWHTSQSKIIDDKLWRRIIADKQLDPFWKRSQVLLEWDGTVTGWDLRGIRIEPEPLIEFLARYGLAVTVDANGQLQVPGQARALTGAGRNTYAHGAPIALLTLELNSGNFEKLGKKNGKPPLKGEMWFSVTDQPIFAVAGFWQQTAEGRSFAMVTCDANELVEPIRPEATIAVQHPENVMTWLR